MSACELPCPMSISQQQIDIEVSSTRTLETGHDAQGRILVGTVLPPRLLRSEYRSEWQKRRFVSSMQCLLNGLINLSLVCAFGNQNQRVARKHCLYSLRCGLFRCGRR